MLSLISSTINMIKALELNTLSVVRDAYSRDYPEESLKNLVWLVWAIEKVICLQEKHVGVRPLH
jgi:hypothetical protein